MAEEYLFRLWRKKTLWDRRKAEEQMRAVSRNYFSPHKREEE